MKSKIGLWELVSLEIDGPARDVGDYFENELGMQIRRVKRKNYGRKHKKYYEKGKICRLVDRVLGKDSRRKLVLYGTGYYHHYTYGLCKYADKFSEEYAYVHFDLHSDTSIESGDEIACAGFVRSILNDTHASVVLYIGSCGPSEALPYKAKLGMTEYELREEGGFEKLESGLALLPQDVYLSFDLDVMPRSLISTPFNQGTLTLEELMKCISIIKKNKYLIGADVLGYGGEDDAGKDIYKRVVDSLMQEGESK